MHTKAFPFIGLLGTLWGTNLVVSRFGIGQFDPIVFAGLRLVIASAAFVLVYTISTRRNWPSSRQLWRHAALLGLMSTAVPMVCILSSLQFQSSGVTALLITTAPAFIAVAAHLFLPDERLTRVKGIGVLLALAGAMLIVARGESGLPDVSQANPLGYGFVFVGLLFETGGAIYIRKHMQSFSSFDVTSVRLLVAGIVVLPLGFGLRGLDPSQINWQGLLSLLYAAIAGAFAAQLMAFYITKRFGATAFSLTAYIIPVVAAITGVFLLGETITIWMVAGMVLIGLGILLINRRQTDPPLSPPT